MTAILSFSAKLITIHNAHALSLKLYQLTAMKKCAEKGQVSDLSCILTQLRHTNSILDFAD